MTGRTLRQTLLVRLPRRSDERGSLPMLMLVIIATVALGGLLLSSVISQTRTTRFDQTRIHSLDAAQTGIDIVLGDIRAAVGSDGTTGDDGSLPCGPWDEHADNGATYKVTIEYFSENPRTGAAPWTVCSDDAGPYDPSTGNRTPRYALITSTGKDGIGGNGASTGRTLQSTYVFQTNDVNITGGQIRIFPEPDGTGDWCMDAGSSPGLNTPVKLEACSTSNPPADQQVWAYRADLSIELVSSAKTPTPLCIDTSDSTEHTANDSIVLKQCVPDTSVCAPRVTSGCTPSPWNQQWSVNDSAHLEGANTTKTGTDNNCIDAPSQAADIPLTIASCAGSVSDPYQTWVPAPTTGAGMAGAANQQLVNYKQFAMCLDVTGQDPRASYLILYTCKQNPNPTNVAWNQKFTPSPTLGAGPSKVLLKTTTDANHSPKNTTFCLKSPGSVGGHPVLVTPCPSSANTPGFGWTVDQKYTDATKSGELAYGDKYTIRDDTVTAYPLQPGGLCLSPGPNSDLHNSEYYKAIVTGCDGSTAQKWNADASLDAATVTNTHEVDSSGN